MKEYMQTTLTDSEVKEANAWMIENLRPEATPDQIEKAAAQVNDLIRVRVREGSIVRNILTPKPIGATDLYPSLVDDDPRCIGEIEPDSPGALVMPFGARPEAWWFFGKRWEARFSRLETPRQMKDSTQLLTYQNDIRQIIADINLKDVLTVEDHRFFMTINNMLSPAGSAAGTLVPGETLTPTGVVQWDTIDDNVNPTSINDALAVMNRSTFGLDPATVVVNLNFAKQMQKWGRDDFGGDLAQEVKVNGFTERKFLGVRWLITIKNWLVPDGTMYMFAPEEFIGKFLILTDSTLHIKKDAYILNFWAYEEVAAVIANIAGVCRVDFTALQSSSVAA